MKWLVTLMFESLPTVSMPRKKYRICADRDTP